MAEPSGRVRPGQRIDTAFSAKAWNRAQEAADIVLDQRPTMNAGQAFARGLSAITIYVKNTSGYPVPMHGVLQLDEPVYDGAYGDLGDAGEEGWRTSELVRRPVLKGVTPSGNTNRFCILLQPLADDAIGLAAVAGALTMRVKVPGSQRYASARVREDDRTQLLAATCGPVRLLWHEDSEGDGKLAVGVIA